MSRSMLIALCSVLTTCSITAHAKGSAASESPPALKPRDWYQDLMTHSPEKLLGTYPHRVLFLKKFRRRELPDLVMLPADAENDKSRFFSMVSDDQIKLFLSSNSINEQTMATGQMSTRQERDFWFRMLLHPVFADTVVVMKDDAKWEVAKWFPDAQSPKIIARIKAPKLTATTKRADYINWLISSLGYNAVVIDVKGEQFLIGMYTPQNSSSGKLQALALKNSVKHFVIKSTSQKGAGLLQSKEIDGPLGVFEVMLSGKGSRIEPGTKIMVETEHKNGDEQKIEELDK